RDERPERRAMEARLEPVELGLDVARRPRLRLGRALLRDVDEEPVLVGPAKLDGRDRDRERVLVEVDVLVGGPRRAGRDEKENDSERMASEAHQSGSDPCASSRPRASAAARTFSTSTLSAASAR